MDDPFLEARELHLQALELLLVAALAQAPRLDVLTGVERGSLPRGLDRCHPGDGNAPQGREGAGNPRSSSWSPRFRDAGSPNDTWPVTAAATTRRARGALSRRGLWRLDPSRWHSRGHPTPDGPWFEPEDFELCLALLEEAIARAECWVARRERALADFDLRAVDNAVLRGAGGRSRGAPAARRGRTSRPGWRTPWRAATSRPGASWSRTTRCRRSTGGSATTRARASATAPASVGTLVQGVHLVQAHVLQVLVVGLERVDERDRLAVGHGNDDVGARHHVREHVLRRLGVHCAGVRRSRRAPGGRSRRARGTGRAAPRGPSAATKRNGSSTTGRASSARSRPSWCSCSRARRQPPRGPRRRAQASILA